MFLLERIKQSSDNFEKAGGEHGGASSNPTSNKAHMFIKLHFWHENNTVSSITLVDMAGYPFKSKQAANMPKNHFDAYQEKHSELNS